MELARKLGFKCMKCSLQIRGRTERSGRGGSREFAAKRSVYYRILMKYRERGTCEAH